MDEERGPRRADQVAALIGAINHLRCDRQIFAELEMHGSVDVMAEAQQRLRRQLQVLGEEGVGYVSLGHLDAVGFGG